MSDFGARADERGSAAGMIAISGEKPSGDDGSSHLISLHIALVKKQDPEGMTLIWERYIACLLRYVASQCQKKPRFLQFLLRVVCDQARHAILIQALAAEGLASTTEVIGTDLRKLYSERLQLDAQSGGLATSTPRLRGSHADKRRRRGSGITCA